MSKTRLKTPTTTIATREDMEALVGEIASLKTKEQKYTAEMNRRINEIRMDYDAALGGIEEELKGKMAIARDWAEAHPGEFGKAKSIAMTHGDVGWRIGNPALKTIPGWTWDRVLEKLREGGALAQVPPGQAGGEQGVYPGRSQRSGRCAQDARLPRGPGGNVLHRASHRSPRGSGSGGRMSNGILSTTPSMQDVIAERIRQVRLEGFTSQGDNEYVEAELSAAAAYYAGHAYCQVNGDDWHGVKKVVPQMELDWPWDAEWFKPSDDPRRNLVKAAALILAEIDRLDRAAGKDASPWRAS